MDESSERRIRGGVSTLGGRWPPRVQCVHLSGRLFQLLTGDRHTPVKVEKESLGKEKVAVFPPNFSSGCSVTTSVGDCCTFWWQEKEANERIRGDVSTSGGRLPPRVQFVHLSRWLLHLFTVSTLVGDYWHLLMIKGNGCHYVELRTQHVCIITRWQRQASRMWEQGVHP